MTVHVSTHAPQPDNAARNFRVEYDLPARLDGLVGKNGLLSRLTLIPIEPVDIDTSWCPFSHYEVDDFGVDPSAHMNIYYVPQTLGDFHWNAIKGLLEEEYDGFNRMVNFNLPGKYLLYVCPCRLKTIIWDDRFGMMVDPVRRTMFAIYAKEFNAVYPFLVSQAALYHNYGYAPAFLSEGFANYLSFAIYDMKKLRAEGGQVPLDSLLDTYSYYRADPRLSDRMSATFVRYLVDHYRVGLFLELYRGADDLNLKPLIEETYGKPISELESEWLNYVDTVSIGFDQAGYFSIQAETMLKYREMAEYSREMLRLASSERDSVDALALMSRAAFFAGDYYAATDHQVEFLQLIDTVGSEWMKLAGYQMMNGEYDQAIQSLDKATEFDSTNSLIAFNRALHSLVTGDTARAKSLFSEIIDNPIGGGQMESQVMLANLLAGSENELERTDAATFYHAVVGALSRQDRRHNPSASQAMWLGIAYLGVNDVGLAQDFLQTALFLETRPFYAGMINLWLGKVADVRGERSVARDHYQEVLAGSSAHYHQEEARRLLQSPYRN
jgi:tetratricopeptide (TPR) repeat protein